MKKTLLLAAIILFINTLSAQNKQVETFDTNTWGWGETSGNNYALVKNGFLEIQTNAYMAVSTGCNLPLDIKRDFKVSFNVIFSQKNIGSFEIFYDISEEEQRSSIFELAFGKYYLYDVTAGSKKLFRPKSAVQGKLNCKIDKKTPVIISIENKSKHLTFFINNVKVYETDKELHSSIWRISYSAPSKGSALLDLKTEKVMIDEVVIEQANIDGEDESYSE
ncbi:MAG: hypothetical protein LBN95_10265 [Prevotellaceae bacterium]|jgi:hypothetical protein|nr:hypothetical protein [Prevotellaceae bacterium]